ncbi:MAG: biotin--[acetyl-CoA-carboxylase] ligase [Pseudomonadota bacterium]
MTEPSMPGKDAVEQLDGEHITRLLRASPLPALMVLDEVDSTNNAVRDIAVQPGQAAVCLAEFQTAGRGRLDRRWLVPSGGGICFSVARRINRPANLLAGLSLAVGVALRGALLDTGVDGVSLKWPNDLLLPGGKVGGILIELVNPTIDGATVIVGSGINFSLSSSAREAVHATGGQPAALRDVTPTVRRNAVAAALIDAVIDALTRFESSGLSAFREEWLAADAMRDREVFVLTGADRVRGVARGIDSIGALAVDVDGERRYFAAGEVSLRRAADAPD